MKHIIVIAGNLTQFQDFVRGAIKKETFTECYSIGFGDKIVVEGITFMYVYSDYQLRGYAFEKNSVLVKVGTWYELPVKTIETIENQFKVRKIPLCKCKSYIENYPDLTIRGKKK